MTCAGLTGGIPRRRQDGPALRHPVERAQRGHAAHSGMPPLHRTPALRTGGAGHVSPNLTATMSDYGIEPLDFYELTTYSLFGAALQGDDGGFRQAPRPGMRVSNAPGGAAQAACGRGLPRARGAAGGGQKGGAAHSDRHGRARDQGGPEPGAHRPHGARLHFRAGPERRGHHPRRGTGAGGQDLGGCGRGPGFRSLRRGEGDRRVPERGHHRARPGRAKGWVRAWARPCSRRNAPTTISACSPRPPAWTSP